MSGKNSILIDAGEQIMYLKFNQDNKIVSKKKKKIPGVHAKNLLILGRQVPILSLVPINMYMQL